MRRSPAAERNKEPIQIVLANYWSHPGRLLEISSGCGTHVAHLSRAFPTVEFYPTEFDQECLASISAHLEAAEPQLPNVHQPQFVDVSLPLCEWPKEIATVKFDYILNVNMVHITPWKCSEGLFNAASELLNKQGRIFMYGPFAVDGVLRPDSNVRFDRSLRQNNPEWGIRDVRDLEMEAGRNSLALEAVHEMPANNKILVWQKQ